MANYVVFIDLDHAKIFELHPEKIEAHTLHRHETHSHSGAEKQKHDRPHEEKFFHQVASRLTGAHEILVVGPGLAKTQFKDHVQKHDHEVNKKVIGVETVDHPTDNQIVALAKKFFKAHLAFEA